MNSPNDYIAVFDSGVGGISVLRELIACMPNERFLYFGDSANAPYGPKTTEQVRALSLQAAQMLKNGYIYSEIATQTGLSTATISRVNRCLKYGDDGYVTVLDRMEKAARRG